MAPLWIVGLACLIQGSGQDFELALDEGISRYWNGEYEATIDALESACSMNADAGEKLECHKYLAFSHVALGADDNAVREFTWMLTADPGYRLDESLVSPKILVRFERARRELAKRIYDDAKTAYRDDEFPRAVELLDRSLALDPANELAREYRELSDERLRLSAAAVAPSPAPTAQPAAGLGDRVYRVTSDIRRPVLVERVAPRYPRLARVRRVEGSVVVSVVIDQDGRVTESKIIRSVDPVLDQTALDAVGEWRYQPATLNGFPVAVHGIIELSFELDGR